MSTKEKNSVKFLTTETAPEVKLERQQGFDPVKLLEAEVEALERENSAGSLELLSWSTFDLSSLPSRFKGDAAEYNNSNHHHHSQSFLLSPSIELLYHFMDLGKMDSALPHNNMVASPLIML